MKHVYFMRPVGQIGPIKIGCSLLPEHRLETYTPWSPIKLEIVAAVPGSHRDEKALHGMFQKHWLHHEWFAASKELLALLEQVKETGELPELPEVIPFPKMRRAPKKGSRKPSGPRQPSVKLIELGRVVAPEYEAGASFAKLSERHGRAIPTIARALKGVGVKARPRGAPKGSGVGIVDTARADEFQRRYIGGETLQQIADDYGISRERVRQILRKADVPSLGYRPEHCKKPNPVTDDEREMAQRYSEGIRPMKLRAMFPHLHLGQVLSRTDTPARTQGAWNIREDDAERTELIATLYAQGLKGREIADRVGLPAVESIYRYLEKAGVKPRRLGIGKGALEVRAQEVIAAYRNGASVKTLAATFECSLSAVYFLLRRHNAKLPKAELERRRVEAVRAANRRRAA